MIARLQLHLGITKLDLLQRLSIRVFPGAFHAVIKPIGKNQTIGFCTGVVFASGNISAGPTEIDLQTIWRILLSLGSRYARKIGGHFSRAVIAHRMCGITAQGRDGLFSVPKTERLEPMINRALGCIGGEHIASTCAATSE